jgi:uncharacterized surface protein with fasciclin (FAS1) repeats
MTKTRSSLALAAAALAAIVALASGGSGSAAAAKPQKNIVGTAAAAGQFTTLVSLAKQAGLAGALSGPGPLTVFAPTDAAFKAVPKATLTKLAADRTALRRVLLYHVVKGDVSAAKVVTLRSAKTLAGPKITIRVKGGSVYLNGTTKVVKTDVAASNGRIHVIDHVLLPPS